MLSMKCYPWLASLGSLCIDLANPTAPVVDLGYGLWQGTLNETGQYYNFSNIRYAQAPVGDLRFAPPQAPFTNRSIVNNGQDGRICPQGYPSWTEERNLFLKQYMSDPSNITAFASASPPGHNASAIAPGPRDGRENEDCLFLQVLVPTSVYANANRSQTAPVMVWTYGGGFYEGNLQSQGNPAGLLDRSIANTSPGMIYVSINYRLGALGWLSGPSFNASGGTLNAGLYDQRMAFQWIQENIAKFGGDPDQVTVSGESAGASMSLHQLTAFGNSSAAPFSKMFLSSPAYHPSANLPLQETIYQQFLKNANASSLADLRKASSETIIRANELSIFQAPYGSSNFGPVVGGEFVPDLPNVLLSQGKFAKNVEAVLVSHNTDEGLLFTNPAVQNSTAFNAYLKTSLFPNTSSTDLDYIINTLYPANFTDRAELGYNDTVSRQATMLADWFINCNADQILTTITPSNAHSWLFAEGAGLHGEDSTYIYFTSPGPIIDPAVGQLANTTSADAMQNWIVSFVVNGDPNHVSNITLPSYPPDRSMSVVSSSQLGKVVPNPALEERCKFWQSAEYMQSLLPASA